jgi:hypothetical protein
MKSITILSGLALGLLFVSCGGETKEQNSESAAPPKSMVEDAPSYDPHRGEGKWNTENIQIGESINQEWATAGETVSGVKCTSCHKMTEEKLVGPGWKGVTQRRTPAWILNFITNPDPMIDKDPQAQAMLELCLVRMPNQNLTDDDARHILEFMRKNDATK